MTLNKEIIDNIIDAIFPLPEEFGLTYTNGESDFDEEYIIYNKVKKIVPSSFINFGATKCVIVSSEWDFVIKIPFHGAFKDDSYYSGLYWQPFEECPDYCLAEYHKYLNLKKEHLNCFVAKTFLYKKIGDYNIFIQEHIDSLDDLYDEDTPCPSQKSLKIAKLIKVRCPFDAEWVANCIDIYGENKVKAFLNYCNMIDPDIYMDMHRANYGYRKNGTPAILDYSNYLD